MSSADGDAVLVRDGIRPVVRGARQEEEALRGMRTQEHSERLSLEGSPKICRGDGDEDDDGDDKDEDERDLYGPFPGRADGDDDDDGDDKDEDERDL